MSKGACSFTISFFQFFNFPSFVKRVDIVRLSCFNFASIKRKYSRFLTWHWEQQPILKYSWQNSSKQTDWVLIQWVFGASVVIVLMVVTVVGEIQPLLEVDQVRPALQPSCDQWGHLATKLEPPARCCNQQTVSFLNLGF